MRVFPKFLLSALSKEQFPPPTVPEIAFLGRSNVGKSSMINALLGSKQAKVSQTPGRTRAINFFAIADSPTRQQPRWIFADLPGYGYAKISKAELHRSISEGPRNSRPLHLSRRQQYFASTQRCSAHRIPGSRRPQISRRRHQSRPPVGKCAS